MKQSLYPHSNLDMACAMEFVVSKLPQTQAMEFRWKIRSILEKSKYSSLTLVKRSWLKVVKYLRLTKDTRFLQADKGKWNVVFVESEYRDKLNILL
jgi:hypothetical protein